MPDCGAYTPMSRAFVKDRDDAPEQVSRRPEAMVTLRSRRADFASWKRAAPLRSRLRRTASHGYRPRARRRRTRGPVADRFWGDRDRPGGRVPKCRQAYVFTIVGPDEIDVLKGRVGVTSPIAQALLGARRGDTVVRNRPNGRPAGARREDRLPGLISPNAVAPGCPRGMPSVALLRSNQHKQLFVLVHSQLRCTETAGSLGGRA